MNWGQIFILTITVLGFIQVLRLAFKELEKDRKKQLENNFFGETK